MSALDENKAIFYRILGLNREQVSLAELHTWYFVVLEIKSVKLAFIVWTLLVARYAEFVMERNKTSCLASSRLRGLFLLSYSLVLMSPLIIVSPQVLKSNDSY
jgi:predicted mannosyl-3-phosphoglycerate phosphatase (HAD superfamily)